MRTPVLPGRICLSPRDRKYTSGTKHNEHGAVTFTLELMLWDLGVEEQTQLKAAAKAVTSSPATELLKVTRCSVDLYAQSHAFLAQNRGGISKGGCTEPPPPFSLGALLGCLTGERPGIKHSLTGR